MTLQGCLIIVSLITLSSAALKCYHSKCETQVLVYTDCDQRFYKCNRYNHYDEGSCEYQGFASEDGYKYCYSEEKCAHHPRTGQAKCVWDASYYDEDLEDDVADDTWADDLGYVDDEGMDGTKVAMSAIFGCVGFGLVFMCCVYCFKERPRKNPGNVITVQAETPHQSTGGVQAAPQTSNQPPPGGYPPVQPALSSDPPPSYQSCV